MEINKIQILDMRIRSKNKSKKNNNQGKRKLAALEPIWELGLKLANFYIKSSAKLFSRRNLNCTTMIVRKK